MKNLITDQEREAMRKGVLPSFIFGLNILFILGLLGGWARENFWLVVFLLLLQAILGMVISHIINQKGSTSFLTFLSGAIHLPLMYFIVKWTGGLNSPFWLAFWFGSLASTLSGQTQLVLPFLFLNCLVAGLSMLPDLDQLDQLGWAESTQLLMRMIILYVGGLMIHQVMIVLDSIQKARIEDKEKLETIIDTAGDAVIVFHEEKGIELFNESAQRLFACSKEQALGSRLEDFMPIEEAQKINQYAISGQVQGIVFQNSNQSYQFFGELSVVKLMDEENMYTVIIRDATMKKKAEDALLASKARLTEHTQMLGKISVFPELDTDMIYCTLHQAMSLTIDTLKADHMIVGLLDIHATLDLYVVEKFASQDPLIYTKNLPDHVLTQVSTLAPDGTIQVEKEMISWITSNQSWVSGLLSSIIHDQKEVGFLAILSNTKREWFPEELSLSNSIADKFSLLLEASKRYTTNQKLISTELKLQQVQKLEAIGTLAGGIAHDFNNLLMPILAYSDLMKESNLLDAECFTMTQEISVAANRARELVKQVLLLSRNSQRKSQPTFIQDIVMESIGLLSRTISSTITIEHQLDTECGPIYGDPTELHQIIMNLCTNSIQAMKTQGGTLKLLLTIESLSVLDCAEEEKFKPGNYALLKVSDTGLGIPTNIKDKIFEPYFTTKDREQGTGLGLSTVHAIVEQLGGNIYVYSEEGVGTTFSIYLPIHQMESNVNTLPMISKYMGNERLLLIDDEEVNHRVVKRLLGGLGYSVVSCSSGVEAINTLQQGIINYDLILSDFMMPDMTGLDVVIAVRSIQKDIPIIICTGFCDISQEQEMRKMGIQALVWKPFTQNHLAKVIRTVLDDQLHKSL